MPSSPGLWISDPAAYRKNLDDKLGNRDPIDVLGKTAGLLATIVNKHQIDDMRARPFEGKWTPNEVIGHLLDAEWVYGYRMRQILCEDNPQILGMDQDLWVSGLRHNDRSPLELVEMFRALRNQNLFHWRNMGSSCLARTGQHNERGPESLGLMLRMLAGHDLHHIDQINRYLEAVAAG